MTADRIDEIKATRMCDILRRNAPGVACTSGKTAFKLAPVADQPRGAAVGTADAAECGMSALPVFVAGIIGGVILGVALVSRCDPDSQDSLTGGVAAALASLSRVSSVSSAERL